MSDLQCAVTVLVAGHAEATDDTDPPTDAGGSLTRRGRVQARAPGDSLARRNVAIVYTSSMPPAVQTAEIVAARLGCDVRVREDLLGLCDHSEDQTRGRVSGVLDEVSDQHRGETVLVIVHGGVMSLVLPRLATNLPATYASSQPLGDTAQVELMADADGWTCLRWGDREPG